MNRFLNNVLTFLFRRRKPNVEKDGEEALLNYALHLAQEWGNDWMQPIQARLGKSYPELSVRELDLLNGLAQEAMHFGYDEAFRLYEQTSGGSNVEEWRKACLSKYAWIDEKNLNHLYSTGRYYAMKEFG